MVIYAAADTGAVSGVLAVTIRAYKIVRTDRLNIMGDSMDRLEESSAGWAEDVSKFVSDQKKKAVMGGMSKCPVFYSISNIQESHW